MRYIDFDMAAVRHLKSCYDDTLMALWEQLPDLNWNSILEVQAYFRQEHGLVLNSLRIAYLKARAEAARDYDSPASLETAAILETFIEYLKVKAIVRNYLDCVLRHTDESGRVYLRLEGGEWVMPNKQPLPRAKELTELVLAEGETHEKAIDGAGLDP